MTELKRALRDAGQLLGVLLDVGHGNAAVFIDGEVAIVVDAGSGDLVTDTLERAGVREIAALVISHRHHDHTSELPALLSNKELCVRRLFLNADPNRNPTSAFETQLRAGLNDSWKRNRTEHHQANITLGGLMSTERIKVEVLWPDIDHALGGVSAPAPEGGIIEPHAFAVVVRVSVETGRTILLGADLDHAGFRSLIDAPGIDLAADLLVYPHHGGNTGAGSAAREEQFATDVTRAVNPELVLFSNGRERFNNPRPEVVRGVRAARDAPKVRVVCTQLSKECSATTFADAGRLDGALRSAGGPDGLSCCGSMQLDLAGTGPLLPFGHKHIDFVVNTVGDSALCMPSQSGA